MTIPPVIFFPPHNPVFPIARGRRFGYIRSMTEPSPVLIIAPAGRLRDSLRVLLRASNHVTQVAQADDLPAGLRLLAELGPKLVVLDAAICDGTLEPVVRQLKARHPRLPCTVLTHTFDQERQAHIGGADGILQAGASAEAFLATIDSALQKLQL